MCTAITFKTNDFYFGRNLDLEYSLDEQVVITPRNYVFEFRNLPNLNSHYSIIGVAKIDNGFPLYFDGTNEQGLSVASLNFPENAVYFPVKDDCNNIAVFEIIPFLLGKYKTVYECVSFLKKANIADIAYSEKYPLTPLHWIISDSEQSVVLEQTKDGINIYENKIGVLTNNPVFPYQIFNLNNYAHLSPENPDSSFSNKLDFDDYSRGLGGLGLPGDFSSMSRFVRAVYAKLLSESEKNEESSISQFFHILSYVSQLRGCVKENKKNEITVYSSCCNTNKGIYYYSTYENRAIHSINMHKENLNADYLIPFDMVRKELIIPQN